MANQFLAGIFGTATINGAVGGINELATKQWNVNSVSDIFKIANSKTGRFRQKFSTFLDGTFTVNFDYDFDNDCFAIGASASLMIGQSITNVKLFLNSPGTSTIDPVASPFFWLFPSAIVRNVTEGVVLESGITTQVDCEASGPYMYPNGLSIPV